MKLKCFYTTKEATEQRDSPQNRVKKLSLMPPETEEEPEPEAGDTPVGGACFFREDEYDLLSAWNLRN